MKNTILDKTKLVNSVFSTVYKKYDLMNDLMSLGAHRTWKEKFIDWMKPHGSSNLIDVASGTGDIARLFSLRTNGSHVTCVEPNKEMFNEGKSKLRKYNNIKWINSSAERIPENNNMYDFYSISFGIRNVSNIDYTLREALRLLKPGGRFMCLEFSKVNNELLNFIYEQYSRAIPYIGKIVIGSEKPYDYLVESIKKFYNQDELSEILKKNGFSDVAYRNLSNGVCAIHSGWKI